jgi:hypothetical protein
MIYRTAGAGSGLTFMSISLPHPQENTKETVTFKKIRTLAF